MVEYQHLSHGFGPVFDERSRVLVLGSFPSVLSRQASFYYGNPQNRFWRVIAACTGESEPRTTEAKRSLLLAHGIALWDVIESCDIRGSSDASIKNVEPVDVARVLGAARIEAVFCNGATAGRLYRRCLRKTSGLDAVVLPSTSPANAGWSLERLIARWSEGLSGYLWDIDAPK